MLRRFEDFTVTFPKLKGVTGMTCIYQGADYQYSRELGVGSLGYAF